MRAAFILALTFVPSQELSAKDKIRIHKEWLDRRAALKAQNQNNNFTSGTFSVQKLLKGKELWKNQRQALTISDFKNTNFAQTSNLENKKISSHNDVFPENDIHFAQTSPMYNPLISSYTTSSPIITSISFPELSTRASDYEAITNISITSSKEDISIHGQTADLIHFTTTPAATKSRIKLKAYSRWTPWGRWSECSRSCGGGIITQERKCVSKLTSGKRIISKECIGLYKRYHLCNQQDCPTMDVDFRHKQCSNFDDVLFNGKMYTWQPYIKEDAECELNCRPVDMKYFATLNHTVIDGTACFRPAEYYRKNYRGRAICVDGICKYMSFNPLSVSFTGVRMRLKGCLLCNTQCILQTF